MNKGLTLIELVVAIAVIMLGGIFIGSVLGGLPFYVVSAGERAVVLRWGAVTDISAEGLHFKVPFMDRVKTVEITTQKEESEAGAASKDLQVVTAKVAVNYNLSPEKVDVLWTQFRGEEQERAIKPAIQEAIKAATAKYTAEELITKRELVKEDIAVNLKESLSKSNIIVTGVFITDFDFSADFNRSIEQKVKAEQDALTAKNKLEQIKFEAEQTIATARATAESIKLQSDAANNDKYVRLKEIEVREQMAKKWNGVLPVNMYASAPLPLLDLTK